MTSSDKYFLESVRNKMYIRLLLCNIYIFVLRRIQELYKIASFQFDAIASCFFLKILRKLSAMNLEDSDSMKIFLSKTGLQGISCEAILINLNIYFLLMRQIRSNNDDENPWPACHLFKRKISSDDFLKISILQCFNVISCVKFTWTSDRVEEKDCAATTVSKNTKLHEISSDKSG